MLSECGLLLNFKQPAVMQVSCCDDKYAFEFKSPKTIELLCGPIVVSPSGMTVSEVNDLISSHPDIEGLVGGAVPLDYYNLAKG